VRHSAVEAAVGQHTQPEPDSLWNLELVQFTEQWGRQRRLAGQWHLGLTGLEVSQTFGHTVYGH